MAWNDITYACGHTSRIQLYGKIKSRDSYIEWAKTGRVCNDCIKKEKEERIKAEFEEAKKLAEKENLPVLKGTVKQIEWAERIRIRMLNDMYTLTGELIQKRLEMMRERKNTTEISELIEYIKEITKVRKEWTRAKDFIDFRDCTSESYFERKLKEKKAKEIGKEAINDSSSSN